MSNDNFNLMRRGIAKATKEPERPINHPHPLWFVMQHTITSVDVEAETHSGRRGPRLLSNDQTRFFHRAQKASSAALV